jgi:hypothetical protein
MGATGQRTDSVNLEDLTVPWNIVKSSRFTESVLCPVAPIVAENIAKLGPIVGKMMDLGILHFLRCSGPGQSSGLKVRKFSLR